MGYSSCLVLGHMAFYLHSPFNIVLLVILFYLLTHIFIVIGYKNRIAGWDSVLNPRYLNSYVTMGPSSCKASGREQSIRQITPTALLQSPERTGSENTISENRKLGFVGAMRTY